MKRISGLLMVTSLMLSACVVVPVDNAPRGNLCPPGQAKKGNCSPDSDRGFCPPGQAKKGAC